MNTPKFVVVHNGRRDDYQVAQALDEMGALHRLVTDFYGVPPLRTSRYSEQLSARKVSTAPRAALYQFSRRWGPAGQRDVDWDVVHRMLGAQAARIAKRGGHGIFAYSGGTAREAFTRSSAGMRVLFVFHPMPLSEFAALDADREFCREYGLRFPRSDDYEAVVAAQSVHDEELVSADVILTASAFTRSGVLARLDELQYSSSSVEDPIPYGSNLPPTEIKAAAIPDRTEVLFIGQALQRKGLHHLLVVWREMGLGVRDARLTVVTGAEDPQMLGLAKGVPTVRILPRQTAVELRALMVESDVLVLPSLVEGFGLVITEALAQGLHVIATKNTGLPDLQPDPLAGQVIAPGRPAELELALRQAMNPERRSRRASQSTAARWPWSRFRDGIVRSIL